MGVGKAESVGIARGVVLNIDQTVASIVKAVKEASEKSGVDIKECECGYCRPAYKKPSAPRY